MDREEILYYHYALRRYVLSDEEIEFFELDQPMFIKFNDFKRQVVREMARYDFFTLSLGANCLPKVLTLAYQLWEPRPQMPFDEMVTPVDACASILDCDFANFKAINVSYHQEGKAIFGYNFGLKLIFNHDYLNIYNPIISEMEKLNAKINMRVDNFKKYSTQNNIVFFINIYGLTSKILADLHKLNEILNNKYSSPLLFVNLLNSQIESIPSEFNVNKIKLPYQGYRWHNPDDYFTDKGFEFEQNIILSYMDMLKLNMVQMNYDVPRKRKLPDKKFMELSKERFLKRSQKSKAEQCSELIAGL